MVQVLAFVSSLLSTSIGIGGGCILIPGLIYCSIEYKKAASTSLALIAVTTFIGTISHLFIVKESIPLLYLCYFIPCCLIGTMLAKPIIHLYKGRGAKIAFSFFIFFVAIKLLGISNTVSFIFFSLKDLLPAVPLFSIVPFALLVGFTATLLGVGCGLVIVPFFIIFHDISMHIAVLMSLISMTFLTTFGAFVHNKAQNLDKKLLKSVAPKTIVGAIVGVLISNLMPGIVLKKIFAITLLIIAIHFFLQEFNLFIKKMQKCKKVT